MEGEEGRGYSCRGGGRGGGFAFSFIDEMPVSSSMVLTTLSMSLNLPETAGVSFSPAVRRRLRSASLPSSSCAGACVAQGQSQVLRRVVVYH